MGVWAIKSKVKIASTAIVPILTTRIVANQYPNAEVLGVDLYPGVSEERPPNLTLVHDYIEHSSWQNGSNWDFIHLRQVTGTLEEPERLVQQSFS